MKITIELFIYFYILIYIIKSSNGEISKSDSILNLKIDEIIENDFEVFLQQYNSQHVQNLKKGIETTKPLDESNNKHLPPYQCQHDKVIKGRKYVKYNVENHGEFPPTNTNNKTSIKLLQDTDNWGRIRIHFDTTHLYNKADRRTCYAVGDKVPLGGSSGANPTRQCDSGSNLAACSFTCTKNFTITTEFANFISNTLSSTISKIFNSLIMVRQQDNLKLLPTLVTSGECDTDYKIPSSYFTDGIDNIDYVVFLTARPTRDVTTIAYALPCSWPISREDGSFGRPIGAGVNVNPSYFIDFVNNPTGFLYKEYIRVFVHEMIHALGFSPNFFSSFRDGDGNLYRDTPGSQISISGRTPSSNFFSYLKPAIGTPSVRDFIRAHFACEDQDFTHMELEDYGSTGTAGSHWEKRVGNEDLMIGYIQPTFFITNLTLSLLQDTGYYKIDFSGSEMWLWGKNLGCPFVRSCSEDAWGPHPGYFCKESELTCTPTRYGKGGCFIQKNSEPLPFRFQHFKDPTLGGIDPASDYCAFSDVSLDVSQTVYCSNGENQHLASSSIYEQYGPDSRCFEYEQFGGLTYGNACWNQRCVGTELQIEIGSGNWQYCPAGTTVKSNGVTIKCPKDYYPCLPTGVPPPQSSSLTLKPTLLLTFLLILTITLIH
ncbi:hypothetical protein DLAC_08785 [Tieghemostelium lacteum]|uniref:Peptidase M8 n=1 Tax=Tieghemostelium lacteum TaxID=361077 RepID=A0A151Z8B9_TIELA|nr:hypothetical protein DLAC_08785 [Tieghemostelium lacteum]|eukprot:KYQ90187.1 hypothetical protein DLAC_08785 [Tieghemostelium lacteum]